MSKRSLLLAAAGIYGQNSLGPTPTTALYGDNSVFLTNTSPPNFKTDYTVSGWVNLDSAAPDGYEYILFNIRGASSNVDDVSVNSTPFVWNLFVQRFGSGVVSGFSADPVVRDAWQHIAMVKSGTTLSLYVQQTLVASGTVDRSGTDPVPDNMRLGSWNGELGPMWNGVYDFKMWTAALSVAELQAEAAQLLPARTANHWGTWILSGPTDLAERDALRNAWTITGTGTTITAPVLPWTA